jgi:hypothetical protein
VGVRAAFGIVMTDILAMLPKTCGESMRR